MNNRDPNWMIIMENLTSMENLTLELKTLSNIRQIVKVYYSANDLESTKEYSATFFYPHDHDDRKVDFPHFLMNFSDLVRKKKAFALQNIREVLWLKGNPELKIVQYFSLFLTKIQLNNNKNQSKSDIESTIISNNKETVLGILFGEDKKQEYHVLGYWPLDIFHITNIENNPKNYQNKNSVYEKVISTSGVKEIFNEILKEPSKFKNVILNSGS